MEQVLSPEHARQVEQSSKRKEQLEQVDISSVEIEQSEEHMNREEAKAFLTEFESAENDFVVGDADAYLELQEPESTSPEYESAKEALTDALAETWIKDRGESALERRSFLSTVYEKGGKILKSLDIDTAGKVAANLLELPPGSGWPIAILGKRPKELALSGMVFEDLDFTSRLSYVAGELSPLPGTTMITEYTLRKVGADKHIENAAQKMKTAFITRLATPLASFTQAMAL